MSMIQEFRKFAIRGNAVDMAVGIIIGGAYGTIVKSLVSDLIMPPIGLFLGGVDFTNLFVTLREGTVAGPYATLADAQSAGAVVLSYGVFGNAVFSFIIVAFSVFLLVKAVNKMERKEAAVAPPPATKDCPHCFSAIPIKATRCPQCTSQIEQETL